LKSIIKTETVTKRFDAVNALDHLTVSLPKSGMTSIVGPNGSGKSTLINILSGILPFEEGLVVIDEQRFRVILPHENPSNGLTRTFQEVRLFEQMTALDNILVVLTKRGVFQSLLERTNSELHGKAKELIDSVGIWHKHDSLASDLSYGQRKLMEIARVLAMDVKVFLFDEPFAGLFPKMLDEVKQLLIALKEKGCTVIFVSHNMDIVRELSDHIIVMDAGSVLAEGDVEEVLNLPEVISAYLGT
jgi:ABC-type branched-subunit amino acid transport system ATPase component